MKKQNLFTTQKGITLVALVVTIVVLLILAGISINLVLGQNGIVAKAKEAKNKTLQDQENTQAGLNTLYDEILDAIGEGTTPTSKTLVQAFKDGELNVGDYVNYQNPTTVQVTGEGYTTTGYTSPGKKTGLPAENIGNANFPSEVTEDLGQTYTLNNNGAPVQWRVLGLNENETQLLLISDHVLSREYDVSATINATNDKNFYLYGAEGCAKEYGVNELNKICAIYTNDYADEVRSINIDDINRLCDVTVDIQPYNPDVDTENKSKVYKAADETQTNINTYSNFGTTYTYTEKYASPENFLAGTKTSFSKECEAYIYKGEDAIDKTIPLYDVLFKDSNNTNGEFYWLASSAVDAGDNILIFGTGYVFAGMVHPFGFIGQFNSEGGEFRGNYEVRPIVTLKSNVTIDDIQKIEAPTE